MNIDDLRLAEEIGREDAAVELQEMSLEITRLRGRVRELEELTTRLKTALETGLAIIESEAACNETRGFPGASERLFRWAEELRRESSGTASSSGEETDG